MDWPTLLIASATSVLCTCHSSLDSMRRIAFFELIWSAGLRIWAFDGREDEDWIWRALCEDDVPYLLVPAIEIR